VGRGFVLLPSHNAYIQPWNKEVIRHIEVTWPVTVVSAEKNGPETRVLLTAQKTFAFELCRTCSTTWCGFCDNRIMAIHFPW
jgi:hypothetical protein